MNAAGCFPALIIQASERLEARRLLADGQDLADALEAVAELLIHR